jgi:hypothetical protein
MSSVEVTLFAATMRAVVTSETCHERHLLTIIGAKLGNTCNATLHTRREVRRRMLEKEDELQKVLRQHWRAPSPEGTCGALSHHEAPNTQPV